MDFSALLERLLNAQLDIGPGILWREIIGNGFGLASAILGMQRKVLAWPIGIVGNVLLFTVFLGGVFHTPQDLDLYGQAARQVFFLAVSVYGWYRWSQFRKSGAGGAEGVGVAPAWAGWKGRVQLLVAAVVLWTISYYALTALGSWGPAADAWILTGSILATYGMARGLRGVLADLDRRGPGRCPAAAHRRLLPVGDHVHRLRRVLHDRLHLLVADRAGRSDPGSGGRRHPADRDRRLTRGRRGAARPGGRPDHPSRISGR